MRSAHLCSATDVQVKSILATTDFSPASDKPLRHAAALARYYDAKLYMMHVVSASGSSMARPDAAVAASELAETDATELVRRLDASGALTGLRHEAIIRTGDVGNELEQVIRLRLVDLVVIGTHSRKGWGKLFLGSVAEQIFRHASCPVLTVGPNSSKPDGMEPTGGVRSLLFATDFKEGSMRALRYALSLSNQHTTRLVLLHVLPSAPPVEDDHGYTAGDGVRMQEEAQLATRQRLEELTADAGLAVEPRFMVELGEPSDCILRAAACLNAEGIIMGLNRNTRIETISHPRSTAYKVACGATCPVLTV